MDLIKFLEMNWFSITGIVGLLSFVIKANNTLNNYKATVEKNNERLEAKIDGIHKDMQSEMKEIKQTFNNKFDDVYEQLQTTETIRKEGSRRTLIIMNGVEATLRTLHDKGANGPVTESLKELERYKSEQAVKL